MVGVGLGQWKGNRSQAPAQQGAPAQHFAALAAIRAQIEANDLLGRRVWWGTRILDRRKGWFNATAHSLILLLGAPGHRRANPETAIPGWEEPASVRPGVRSDPGDC
jgi:hypothetical protein